MNTESPTVYLNGQYLPLNQAQVSVLDRGFLFGDGIYEVIPAYGGKPFRLQHHLERLGSSLKNIRIANPMSNDEWEAVLNKIVEANAGEDQSLYVQITRGVAPKRDHGFPAEVHPTVFIMSTPLHPVDESVATHGVRAITLDDIRWIRCDIKAITLLSNVMLRQQAMDEGAVEAILVRDGLVTEGAASNFFLVKDGVLITPPKSAHLLPGITRDLVLELADANQIPHQEREVKRDELDSADELWLSSSTKEVLPVTELDGKPVGNGKPGPMWQRMIRIYQEYKHTLRQ